MMDLVYLLGTGSKSNDIEIRLSIRSAVKNMKYRNIWIIGEKPNWTRGINKQYVPDISKSKITNTQYKLLQACDNEKISEDFILMNDDFFIMKPYEYKPEHRGSLTNSIKKHPTKQGYYYEALVNTKKYLKRGATDYSLHKPMIMNKTRLRAILGEIEGKELLTRTVYGNLCKIGGTEVKDVKIKHIEQLDDFKDLDVISTSDLVVRRKGFVELMRENFYQKTKHEKYDIRI